MMYMDDAVKATIELMEAPSGKIRIRTSYNIAAISFSPEEIAEAIRTRIPGFIMECKPDQRKEIAASWNDSIDDSAARRVWYWIHEIVLDRIPERRMEKL